jgi:hypothetical protein
MYIHIDTFIMFQLYVYKYTNAYRGSFGDQAIHELYPKLLKRLDDSSDSVRISVCGCLEMFLLSGMNLLRICFHFVLMHFWRGMDYRFCKCP